MSLRAICTLSIVLGLARGITDDVPEVSLIHLRSSDGTDTSQTEEEEVVASAEEQPTYNSLVEQMPSGNMCPSDRPHPYFYSKYCCKTNYEKTSTFLGAGCDGSIFLAGGAESLCCKDDDYVICEFPLGCGNYQGVVFQDKCKAGEMYYNNACQKNPSQWVPYGIFVDDSDNMYVSAGLTSDQLSESVLVLPAGGSSFQLLLGGNGWGSANNQMYSAYAIIVRKGYIYVSECQRKTISKWRLDGPNLPKTEDRVIVASLTSFARPWHFIFDADDNLYAGDYAGSSQILKFPKGSSKDDGILISNKVPAIDLLLDQQGNLYGLANMKIYRFAKNAKTSTGFDSDPTVWASLEKVPPGPGQIPSSMAWAATGKFDTIYTQLSYESTGKWYGNVYKVQEDTGAAPVAVPNTELAFQMLAFLDKNDNYYVAKTVSKSNSQYATMGVYKYDKNMKLLGLLGGN